MTESLGEMIRRLRKERGLSQRELAERAHVSESHVSNVELGRFRAGPGVLAALGDALGADLSTHSSQSYPGWVPTSDSVALVPVHQPDGSVIIVEMNRRAFLATASLAAGAAAIAIPDPVTPDVVTALSDRLDWHYAAGHTTPPTTLSAVVRGDVRQINKTARLAPPPLRRQMLTLNARYAEFLGWMRQEAGDIDGALYWTNHAADLAHAAGWRPMVAYTMSRKALIVLDRDPHLAADLARTASSGPLKLSPGLVALAAAQEAEARAAAGTEYRRALDKAHASLAAADQASEPPLGPPSLWDGTLPVLAGARCAMLQGEVPDRLALDAIATSVAHSDSARHRAVDGAWLASAYATAEDIDSACRFAHIAAANGQRCDSASARRGLRALRPALQPWAGRDDVDQVLAALPA